MFDYITNKITLQ